jgi:hypothetical protein
MLRGSTGVVRFPRTSLQVRSSWFEEIRFQKSPVQVQSFPCELAAELGGLALRFGMAL